MEIHIIRQNEILPSPIFVEMETVPRIGETITFIPFKRNDKVFTVVDIDYSIKDKDQFLVRVWVAD